MGRNVEVIVSFGGLHEKTDTSLVEEEDPFGNTYTSIREKILVMHLEETEAMNDCAGQTKEQFNLIFCWRVREWRGLGLSRTRNQEPLCWRGPNLSEF
jgi:hypothetical protein